MGVAGYSMTKDDYLRRLRRIEMLRRHSRIGKRHGRYGRQQGRRRDSQYDLHENSPRTPLNTRLVDRTGRSNGESESRPCLLLRRSDTGCGGQPGSRHPRAFVSVSTQIAAKVARC